MHKEEISMEEEDATRPFNTFNTLMFALEPGSGTMSTNFFPHRDPFISGEFDCCGPEIEAYGPPVLPFANCWWGH